MRRTACLLLLGAVPTLAYQLDGGRRQFILGRARAAGLMTVCPSIVRAPDALARNLPESNGARGNKRGTVDALVPIVQLGAVVEAAAKAARVADLPTCAKCLKTIPSDERKFKAMFDEFSDDVTCEWPLLRVSSVAVAVSGRKLQFATSPRAAFSPRTRPSPPDLITSSSPHDRHRATVVVPTKDLRQTDAMPTLGTPTDKQVYMDQNAFLVYYTQGFDGPGRPKMEDEAPSLLSRQNGFRNDAWAALDDARAEVEYLLSSPGGGTAAPADSAELRSYADAAQSAVQAYVALAPPALRDAAMSQLNP